MIANKQVWVYEIQGPDDKPHIASIVAVTRKSEAVPDVAAITKVYTPEKWRGRRCAQKLVHHVCTEYELATL